MKKTIKKKKRKIFIDYIDLKNFYNKIDNFTDDQVRKFIQENSSELKQDYIDFSFIKITPKNLIGLDEFNQAFFNKIDEIENKISKNIDFKTIVKELNIKPIIKTNYIIVENENTIENKIYNARKNKTELLEDNESYILYQIDKINTKLPNLNNSEFKNQITQLLYNKEKFEFNKNILDEINNKKFNQLSFDKLSNNSTKKIIINSIEDNKKFDTNSIKILYSLPLNSFTLIGDKNNNVYLAKIIKNEEVNINKNLEDFDEFSLNVKNKHKANILKSYDFFLNDKYKVTINQKTLDRVKNFFR